MSFQGRVIGAAISYISEISHATRLRIGKQFVPVSSVLESLRVSHNDGGGIPTRTNGSKNGETARCGILWRRSGRNLVGLLSM